MNYAGVARHFSDAYVLIANEAGDVPILPTLAGINYYQGKFFPSVIVFEFWGFGDKQNRKTFLAISFIALHLEFLSFLLMIPTSTRDATIDFIDDITNRVSGQRESFPAVPAQIYELSLTPNFGILIQPIAS